MKTIHALTIVILFVFCSCNSVEKKSAQKLRFGLYETIKVNDLPVSLIDTLKKTNILLEKDTQLPIIGYFQNNDPIAIQPALPKEKIKLVKIAFPVDNENKYYALVAIKYRPFITNSDIQKAKKTGKNVEIHFNMDGSKKWADMTRKNIGNMLAFVIDNKIYSMPFIKDEIKNGKALINGLENETMAKELSASLNAGISD